MVVEQAIFGEVRAGHGLKVASASHAWLARLSVCTGNPLGRIELRASSRPHFKFKLVSIYLRSLNFGGRNGRDFEIHNRYGD